MTDGSAGWRGRIAARPLKLRSALAGKARTQSATPCPGRRGASSSRAEGEGMRLVWSDPLAGGGAQACPLWRSFDRVSVPDHEILALPAALSGFRLTRLAGPMRRHGGFLGPTESTLRHRRRWHFSIPDCKRAASCRLGQQGGFFMSRNAKTPVMRFVTPTGVLARSAEGACQSGNLPRCWREVIA